MLCCDKHRSARPWFSRTEISEAWSSRKHLRQNTEMRQSMKRIVIVGAGFAGLAAAKALQHAKAEVLVIDRANHNLFQPLLYQVATTVLSPAQIASPIRELLKNQRNTTVFLGHVTGIKKDAKLVYLTNEHQEDAPLRYDTLIIATGV